MDDIIEEVYHGTTNSNAEKILKENKYCAGDENVNEQFLGKGIYFFRNSQHAVMWNLKRARDIKLRKLSYKRYKIMYTVIKSKIKYKRKNMLDLNNINDIVKYDKICKKIKQKFLNDTDYKNAIHKDRAIINYLYNKELMDGIFIIRKISSQTPKVDKLNVVDFIQRDILCVKNDSVINDIGKCIITEENEYNNIKEISF